jgi:hypothetical protein
VRPHSVWSTLWSSQIRTRLELLSAPLAARPCGHRPLDEAESGL